jgi:hypothetical protein
MIKSKVTSNICSRGLNPGVVSLFLDKLNDDLRGYEPIINPNHLRQHDVTQVTNCNVSYDVRRTPLENGVQYELHFSAMGYDKEYISVDSVDLNKIQIKGTGGGLFGTEELNATIYTELNLSKAKVNVMLDKGILKLVLVGENRLMTRKFEIK